MLPVMPLQAGLFGESFVALITHVGPQTQVGLHVTPQNVLLTAHLGKNNNKLVVSK